MPSQKSKAKGLKPGQIVKVKLTKEQRDQLRQETGADAEYLLVTAMNKPVSIVHVQGHLADDAIVD